MAIPLQHRRGTEAENNSFTGALAELTIDTTNNKIRVHNGSTVGGTIVANKVDIDTGKKLWQNQATTITPSANADYTLTADQNTYGRLKLVNGSWLSAHNIIVDNTERSFLVDNSAGTYTATVKTSAGTGIAIAAGTKVWLLCDGTNVIRVENWESSNTTGVSIGGGETLYPDGTICGSNANGSYTKYPNGDLICRLRRDTVSGTPILVEGYYVGTAFDWTFPHNFVATTYVLSGFAKWKSGASPISIASTSGSTNTTSLFYGIRAVYGAGTASTVSDMYIEVNGRWK